MVRLHEENKPDIAQYSTYEPKLFEKSERKDKLNISLGSADSVNNNNMLASTRSGGAEYLSEVQHPDYFENDSMFAQSFSNDSRRKATKLDETLEFHHNYSGSSLEESESPNTESPGSSGTTSPSDDCSSLESPESPASELNQPK